MAVVRDFPPLFLRRLGFCGAVPCTTDSRCGSNCLYSSSFSLAAFVDDDPGRLPWRGPSDDEQILPLYSDESQWGGTRA